MIFEPELYCLTSSDELEANIAILPPTAEKPIIKIRPSANNLFSARTRVFNCRT